MPFTTTRYRFSLKTKVLLRGLLLILIIIIACLQVYLKLHSIESGIRHLETMRAEDTAIDDLFDTSEILNKSYVEAIKDLSKLTTPDLDSQFQHLVAKSQIAAELPATVTGPFEKGIKRSYAMVQQARIDFVQGNTESARQILYKSHLDLSNTMEALKSTDRIMDKEYARRRLEMRAIILSRPYEQLWILIGCMIVMLMLVVSLALDVTLPIREMGNHMVRASRDTANARKYNLTSIRNDEIGVIQKALNDLLTEVEQNIQRSLGAEALSLQRLAAIEAAGEGVAIIDSYGMLIYANRALFKLHGIAMNDSGQYINRSWKLLYSAQAQTDIDTKVMPEIKRKGFWSGEAPILRKDGVIAIAELSLTRLSDGGLVGTARDITARIAAEEEREQLQNQFVQVQKLESVGRLTGGIAHDFNNMLTIIDGNLDMAAYGLAPNSETEKYIKTAKRAIIRGAELTQRLLAFSRSQTLKPKIVNLNAVIPEATMMIIRAIGEQVEIIFNLADDLALTEIDVGQFENALINLAINARDAMPEGGYIRIKTQNKVLDQESQIHEGTIAPGEYVMIEIADTGHGIPEEMQHQIFDPFFTTKGVGEGSGLGLSMVYGFVKQSGGHIQVESKQGVGTAIRMFFPRSEIQKIENTSTGVLNTGDITLDKPLTGTETILLAEDESEILDLNREILTKLGYTVHCAPDGNEALFMARQIEHLDMLITDIVMPGTLNGYAVAEEIQALFPSVKTLFISGYAPPQDGKSDQLDSSNLLSKPYISRQLAERVREILDKA